MKRDNLLNELVIQVNEKNDTFEIYDLYRSVSIAMDIKTLSEAKALKRMYFNGYYDACQDCTSTY